MTLPMIDGMDAAERLGLRADPDEDVDLRHARASLAAGVYDVVERYAADSGREGRGRGSLRSSAGYSQPRFPEVTAAGIMPGGGAGPRC